MTSDSKGGKGPMATVHGHNVSGTHVPRLLAAGLGAALQAADAMMELGAETATAAARQARTTAVCADRAYRAAAHRGESTLRRIAGQTTGHIDRAADETRARVGHAADAAAGWAEREIVRRVARSMTPFFVYELVPEVLDGVLPKVRTDVVPVVIDDLAGDAQIRAMVAQQSRGMLTWSVTEVRRASTGADERVETALRRLLGRRGIRE